jgi:ABC-type transport system involved in multi-copper enzyme maturation permease subunit
MMNLLNYIWKTDFLEKTSYLITIGGIVFAAITVFIANKSFKAVVAQIDEMKLQRISSQEPDIFIESMKASIDFNIDEIPFDADIISQGIRYSNENLLPITITNIGNGVARYISTTIFFEKDLLKNTVEIDKENIFNLRLLLTDYDMEFFQFEYEGENKSSGVNYDVDKKKNEHVNYLLPKQSAIIYLNYELMRLFVLMIYLKSKHADDNNYMPQLMIRIKYYDSYNSEYSKDVNIFLSTYRINRSILNTEPLIDFELNALNRLPIKIKG